MFKPRLFGLASTLDPASIVPNSPQENIFLECMNEANWCTDDFHCEKPGA